MTSPLTQLRKFVAPEIIFGDGARHAAGNYVTTFGAEKVLLVSDPGVLLAGWVSDILAKLLDATSAVERFTAVCHNHLGDEF
ncbi:MAG: iron-containing alcohol dehydrogenase, partial [Halomonas sp.]|nr:iron-containing alcohol dehydrogenase [Halomonas sp.]